MSHHGNGDGRAGVSEMAPPAAVTNEPEPVLLIPLDRIRKFEGQPREYFEDISELAASIKEVGQIQPGVVVRVLDDPNHDFELVDGERRYLACREAGLTSFRATLRKIRNSAEQFEVSVAANFCRQSHSPMEIAWALKRLREEGRTHQQVAAICGKSVPWVIQHLNLVKLTPQVQELMNPALPEDARLSFSLAIMLSSLVPEEQPKVARTILDKKLDVKQAQALIHRLVDENPGIHEGRRRGPGERFAVFRGMLERVIRETDTWCQKEPEGYITRLVAARTREDYLAVLELIQTAIGNLNWLTEAVRQARK